MAYVDTLRYQTVFQKQKHQTLSGADLSRKGNIDQPIAELIQLINDIPAYFTTSSCSGRVCVFEEVPNVKKKGCRWLHTTHDECQLSDVLSAVERAQGDAVFKFEPFVLHVQCHSLTNAQILHQEAVAAGFRNSGLTCSKKGKIMAAVRSTHSLEVPLTHHGESLVSEQYLAFLVELANKKMTENLTRINRFYHGIKQVLGEDTGKETEKGLNSSRKSTKVRDRMRKRKNSVRTCSDQKTDKKTEKIDTTARDLSENEVDLEGCLDWCQDLT